MKQVLRVFDIDGTLFDTFEKNKRSYEAAGLPFEYTKWHFANNKALWPVKPDSSVFKRKSEIQHKFMHLVHIGPAFDDFLKLDGHKVTLTGSQKIAVEELEKMFDIDLHCIGYDKTKTQKLEILKAYQAFYDVVYYEDDADIAEWLSSEGINVVLVKE